MSRLEEKAGFPEFAARTGIQLVLQFGSTVRGVRHPFSDVDIAVQFDRADVPLERGHPPPKDSYESFQNDVFEYWSSTNRYATNLYISVAKPL